MSENVTSGEQSRGLLRSGSQRKGDWGETAASLAEGLFNLDRWINKWDRLSFRGQSAFTSASILDFVHLAFQIHINIHRYWAYIETRERELEEEQHCNHALYLVGNAYRPHTNVYCALADDTRLEFTGTDCWTPPSITC